MYKARFDGGCIPNPRGHASSACVIYKGDKEVYRQSEYLGFGPGNTNNVAEFHGVLMILKWLNDFGQNQPCEIIGDSQIVINRMNSRTLPKGVCKAKAYDCMICSSWYKGKITYKWERRDNNSDCDSMCDAEIKIAFQNQQPWGLPSLFDEVAQHRKLYMGTPDMVTKSEFRTIKKNDWKKKKVKKEGSGKFNHEVRGASRKTALKSTMAGKMVVVRKES